MRTYLWIEKYPLAVVTQNTLGAFEATVEVLGDGHATDSDSGWAKMKISAPPESLLHIRPAHTLVSREREPPRSVSFTRQVKAQRPDALDDNLLHHIVHHSESHTVHRFADPREGYVATMYPRHYLRMLDLSAKISTHRSESLSEAHVHTTVTLVSRSSAKQSYAKHEPAMELRRRLTSTKHSPHELTLVADPRATARCVPVDVDTLWNLLEDLQYAGKFETEHMVCLTLAYWWCALIRQYLMCRFRLNNYESCSCHRRTAARTSYLHSSTGRMICQNCLHMR